MGRVLHALILVVLGLRGSEGALSQVSLFCAANPTPLVMPGWAQHNSLKFPIEVFWTCSIVLNISRGLMRLYKFLF